MLTQPNKRMTEREGILRKVKKHSIHKIKSTREQEQLATELTTPAKIRDRFTHLLDSGKALAHEILEHDGEQLNSFEFEVQHQKLKQDTSKICHLPIRLSLHKVRSFRTPPGAYSFAKKLKMEYGPLHAAVIVGDVVVEWGTEELVEPRHDLNYVTEFLANVADQGEWQERQEHIQAGISLADRQGDIEEKLHIVCKSMEEKSKMIDKLVDLIVEYNSSKKYHLFKCNCQHFVHEALATLGIKNPIKFEGRLQEIFEQKKKGKVKVPHDLKTHKSLDEYAKAHKHELKLQDLEYLQCLYFKEHLPKIERSGDPEEWVCGLPSCMSNELDDLIRAYSNPHSKPLDDQAPLNERDPIGQPCIENCGSLAENDTGLCMRCSLVVQEAQVALDRGKDSMEVDVRHENYSHNGHPKNCYDCHQEINKLGALPDNTTPAQTITSQMHTRQSAIGNGLRVIQRSPIVVPCINNCGQLGNEENAGLCSQCYQVALRTAQNEERARLRH